MFGLGKKKGSNREIHQPLLDPNEQSSSSYTAWRDSSADSQDTEPHQTYGSAECQDDSQTQWVDNRSRSMEEDVSALQGVPHFVREGSSSSSEPLSDAVKCMKMIEAVVKGSDIDLRHVELYDETAESFRKLYIHQIIILKAITDIYVKETPKGTIIRAMAATEHGIMAKSAVEAYNALDQLRGRYRKLVKKSMTTQTAQRCI